VALGGGDAGRGGRELERLIDGLRRRLLATLSLNAPRTFRAVAEDAPLIAQHLGWPNPDALMDLPDHTVLAKLLRVNPETGKRAPSQVLQIDLTPLPEPTGSQEYANRAQPPRVWQARSGD
jgi:hypothetical protein